MSRTRISPGIIALSAVFLLTVGAFLAASFEMFDWNPLSNEASGESAVKTKEADDNSSQKPLASIDRDPSPNLKHRHSDDKTNPISVELEDDEANIEKLEPSKHRVARVFKWLAPAERAVLVHSELETASIQTGHSVSELGLPVSESTILKFIENVETLIEHENQDIELQIRELRVQHYGSANAKIIENLEALRVD